MSLRVAPLSTQKPSEANLKTPIFDIKKLASAQKRCSVFNGRDGIND
jgi:hypothetical protein